MGALAYPHWFQIQWGRELPALSIAFKDLLPIVVAAAVWRHRWRGTYILGYADKMAAVAQVNTLHARDSPTAHLLRCLVFFQAHFRMRAVHNPGCLNINAINLSQNRAQVVCHCCCPLNPSRSPQNCWTSCYRAQPPGHPRPGGGS